MDEVEGRLLGGFRLGWWVARVVAMPGNSIGTDWESDDLETAVILRSICLFRSDFCRPLEERPSEIAAQHRSARAATPIRCRNYNWVRSQRSADVLLRSQCSHRVDLGSAARRDQDCGRALRLSSSARQNSANSGQTFGEISCDPSPRIPSNFSRTSINCGDNNKYRSAPGGPTGVSATRVAGSGWTVRGILHGELDFTQIQAW